MEKFHPKPQFTIQVVSPQDWRAEIVLIPFLATDTTDLLLRETHGAGQELWIPIRSQGNLAAEDLRQAGGKAARWLLKRRVQVAGLRVMDLNRLGALDAVSPFCEGLLLGAFTSPDYKTGTRERSKTLIQLLAEGNEQFMQNAVQRASILAEGVNLARAIADQPPNLLNPQTLAESALALAEQDRLSCKVMEEKDLVAMGAGAILAVGQGSQTPPRLIVLEYPGRGAQMGASPVAVIGKALTFDSGGYMVKDRASIVGMKYDKCGAAAVLGLMHTVSKLELKTPLVGIIPAAENMISAAAFRPDDVIRTLSSKTVEVTSTDAEGRLVLCDALTYAQQRYQPRALIDLATLTYGVVAALGRMRAGLMCENDDLASALLACGEHTGERLWRLPLDDDYLEYLHSDIADLKNYSGTKDASPVTGGVFLKQFVSPDIPWAHLDILGVATTDKELPYCPKGATGFGVRLLVEYLNLFGSG